MTHAYFLDIIDKLFALDFGYSHEGHDFLGFEDKLKDLHELGFVEISFTLEIEELMLVILLLPLPLLPFHPVSEEVYLDRLVINLYHFYYPRTQVLPAQVLGIIRKEH